jgi:hypothetical protein
MITLVIGRREQGKTTLAYCEAKRQPTVIIFDPRGTFTDEKEGDGRDLYTRLNEDSRIVVHPQGSVIESFNDMCETVKDWIRDNPDEPIALLVDEARFIDTPSEVPPALDYIIRFFGTKNVHVILTMHRPVDVAVDIRAIADVWCMFRTTQEHDLKVIAEHCGGDVADRVATLGAREFVAWNDAKAEVYVNTRPGSWYVALNPLVTSAENSKRAQVGA